MNTEEMFVYQRNSDGSPSGNYVKQKTVKQNLNRLKPRLKPRVDLYSYLKFAILIVTYYCIPDFLNQVIINWQEV